MREDEGGDLPTAYLVQQVFFAIFYEPIFFAIFFMQRFFLQLSSYLSYLILNILSSIYKVGVVSSGSGATGHCAGANRPGNSQSEIGGLLSAFKNLAL